jgi:hypothetical protein
VCKGQAKPIVHSYLHDILAYTTSTQQTRFPRGIKLIDSGSLFPTCMTGRLHLITLPSFFRLPDLPALPDSLRPSVT